MTFSPLSLPNILILTFLLLCDSYTTKFPLSLKNVGKSKSLQSKLYEQLEVELDDRSYPIYIGKGLLESGEQLKKHIKSKKVLIVTNDKIAPFYLKTIRESLKNSGIEIFDVILPDGEIYKNMDILMKIIDAAMINKLDRKSMFIALGGGVIGDMTGDF